MTSSNGFVEVIKDAFPTLVKNLGLSYKLPNLIYVCDELAMGAILYTDFVPTPHAPFKNKKYSEGIFQI
jgi:hypothetical protein